MGASQSCPKDFEMGLVFNCRHVCPNRFKYVQDTSTGGPILESCVSMYNNDVKFSLKSFPAPQPGLPEPEEYQAERDRVSGEAKSLSQSLASQQPVYDVLQDVRADFAGKAQAVSQIQSEYARYAEHFEDRPPATVKDVIDALKPLRPPTAPASDLAIARKGVLESSAPNFLLIQVELAIVILCLLAYSFLPLEQAPGVTILLLSVGVALGIFLWK